MSLLIKALDKAQAEKAQAEEGKTKAKKATTKTSKPRKPRSGASEKASPDADTLSLSPKEVSLAEDEIEAKIAPDSPQTDDLPAAVKGSAAVNDVKDRPQTPELSIAPEAVEISSAQVQAANVFTSKRIEPKHQTAKIAMIFGLLALAVLAVVAYWYQFVLNQPDVVIPPKPASFEPSASIQSQPQQAMEDDVQPLELAVETEAEQAQEGIALQTVEANSAEIDSAPVAPERSLNTNLEQDSAASETIKAMSPRAESTTTAPAAEATTSVFNQDQASNNVEATLADNEKVVSVESPIEDTLDIAVMEPQQDNGFADIQITQKKTDTGVNTILMRAYEAYNAGNDAQAQADYKIVLQRYGLNVDAMLGLGAIASRQSRQADAQAWYQKVLQVEPRNEVAKAGLLNLQGAQQQVLNQSEIKSMLQSAPNDANLQATLGDTYAQQGQWSDAQQAYFEAYRLKQSAENAFNLAVSLDQLGKSGLALPYYQEALLKIDQSKTIDRAALEARIRSIE